MSDFDDFDIEDQDDIDLIVDGGGDGAVEVIASPNPGPQTLLLTCPVEEIMYGGGRGGGKTFGLGLDWIAHASRYGRYAKGILFRRTYDELDEVIDQFSKLLVPIGGSWKAGARVFVMPNGATLKLRYLDRDADADHYQGHQYTWIAFDEAGNWATPAAINKLRACLRSSHVPAAGRRFILTGNPGGPGHNWLKARYIDPVPPFKVHRETDEDGVTRERVFIPSLLKDNPALDKVDPGYRSRLREAGPEWLVKAWIEGDWNIVAGGMFDDVWGAKTLIAPFKVPLSWYVDRAFDWGSAKPFSVGWYAESDGTPAVYPDGKQVHFPRGTVIRIAEWYGASGPNTGLKLTAREVARGILSHEKRMRGGLLPESVMIRPGPADSAIYSSDNGPSIADEMAAEGVKWVPADKGPGSRKSGWQRCRTMLKAAGTEEPAFHAFNTCRDFARTVPVLPRSSKDVEDVDTGAEDHAADEWRYRLNTIKRTLTVQKIKGL